MEDKRALVIVAHPDDAEWSAGGTIAKWVQEGWTVTLVICTDGGSGGPANANDVSFEARQRIIDTRHEEQQKAAKILGINEVIHLDYCDGSLQPSQALRYDLVRLMRTYCPYRIVSHAPERNWSAGVLANHPDHLACGAATVAAFYPSCYNVWDFVDLLDQGLHPHCVRELYLFNAPLINTWVDISSTLDQKMAALSAHGSQFKSKDHTALREVKTETFYRITNEEAEP